ncbi:proline racemase family protein [Ekhidna sp.]
MYSISSYKIPTNWRSIKTIDMHTCGEPLRVILDGFPSLEGSSVLDYRRFIKSNYDYLRTSLMFEPRGHADMYGVVITPSTVADFGVVFLHNEGYSTMCGHATLAIAKLAVEAGWVEKIEPLTKIKIEAPCGILDAFVTVKNGKATEVRFHNVPSFVVALDQEVEVEGLGNVQYDLAYGGAYYAFVDAQSLGLKCSPEDYRSLIESGMDIKRAVMKQKEIIHPLEEDLGFLYGTIFTEESPTAHSRNVCIFAEGEVDRSPTGSGVSARLALEYARNKITIGEKIKIESILRTEFQCSVIKTIDYEGIDAIVPEVEGTAHVTGVNTFLIDPEDPLKDGFILR